MRTFFNERVINANNVHNTNEK